MKFKIWILLFTILHVSSGIKAGDDVLSDEYIQEQVQQELADKLIQQKQEISQESFIEKRVREEVAEKLAEDKKKKMRWPASRRRYKKIYPLPFWPYYTLFFDHRDMIQITADFQFASQAYSSHGASEDLSKLAFGQAPITLQNILLVSSLIQQDKFILPCVSQAVATACPTLVTQVTPGSGAACNFGGVSPQYTVNKNGYYLGALACQVFDFDASEHNYQVALNYSRNFAHGDVTVGFHVPVIAKSHTLTLNPTCIDPAIQANLNCIANNSGNSALNFTQTYGTLENFFQAILNAKKITFNHKSTDVALGDFVGFLNFRVHSPRVSRLMFGASVLIPTGRKRNPSQLWPVEFGNGGFVELAGFGSVLWGNGGVWNPYLHAKVSGSIAAHVERRVPQIVSYNASNPALTGQSPCAAGLNILLSSAVGLQSAANGGAFCQPDSTVRGFADTVHRIKIHRGPEFFGQLGNIFAGIFSRKDFLDLYYDLFLKGRDYLASTQNRTTLSPDIWTANTFRVSHTIGLNYSYQFNESYRARLGGSYVFAGRNTPKTFGIDLQLNIDF